MQIVFQLGAGNQITAALCNARCPVRTYFMGYLDGVLGGFSGISAFKDLKVSSSAIATRNPRLIMVVVDRSGSMLFDGGGAFGLPAAVVTFLNFFRHHLGLHRPRLLQQRGAPGNSPDHQLPLRRHQRSLRHLPVNTNVSPSVALPGVDPEAYTNVNYASGTGSPPPPAPE